MISAVQEGWKGGITKEGLIYLLGEGVEKKVARGHLYFIHHWGLVSGPKKLSTLTTQHWNPNIPKIRF